jgi:nitrate reductase beta subunit
MPEAYNWQLKKRHNYPYERKLPKRQIAWVFDTNKCIACQTCTVACKTTWTSGKGQEHMFWNNVESKPWGFYPMAWDVKLLEMLGPQKWGPKGFAGKTIFDEKADTGEVTGYLPEAEDWAHPNLGEDEINSPIPERANMALPHDRWMFYLARICNHCTQPACLAACPRKAIYKRSEDGIVLIDQERCRGYQKCVEACPYKKPMFNPNTMRSEKCIGCYPLVEKGLAPRCVQTCIGKIRLVGYINSPDKADPDNPVDYLVHTAKVALPLYAQFGTMPNVYYIPPIHVSPDFLRQLFGPNVGEAIETYKRRDPKLVGLLSLFTSTDKVLERFEVKDGQAMGFQKGKQVVKVPVQEPIIFRVFEDKKFGVYRQSVT